MDIQSIYAATKTPSATNSPTDDESGSAGGFAALLNSIGAQFKSSLGFGTMDPGVLKKDVEADKPAEPRETKPRAERSDERDNAKAKPAKDDDNTDDNATDETASADTEQDAANTDAQAQTGQNEAAAQAAVTAATDVTLTTDTQVAAPVVAAQTKTETTTETVVAKTETIVADVAATDTGEATDETAVDPKAALTQATATTGEKTATVETGPKEIARNQQAAANTAPVQTTQTLDSTADAETVTVETKATAKEATTSRASDLRSAAAQEQANHLSRMLGNENRVQVQVSVNQAQTVKVVNPDVSVYNIYSGYTAAEAVSLANGQFGQGETGNAAAGTTKPADGQAQAAVAAQAQPVPSPANANTNGAATSARTDGVAPTAVTASGNAGSANNANLNFSAFNSGAQTNAGGQTQAAQQPNPTDRPAATANQVIDQIKVNITRAAKAGLDRVTIQLKPVELGRIEIKLEMSEDHKVRVTVTADNKDTLNLLQNDARALERTLNDAGLRTDTNNLHFNLRSDSDARTADGQNGQGRGPGGDQGNPDGDTANDNAPVYDYAAAANARGGVDTFA